MSKNRGSEWGASNEEGLLQATGFEKAGRRQVDTGGRPQPGASGQESVSTWSPARSPARDSAGFCPVRLDSVQRGRI